MLHFCNNNNYGVTCMYDKANVMTTLLFKLRDKLICNMSNSAMPGFL